jgi:membrane fusion protein (multidrug efflux system)
MNVTKLSKSTRILMILGLLVLVGAMVSCGGSDAAERGGSDGAIAAGDSESKENVNGEDESGQKEDGEKVDEEEAVPVEIAMLVRGPIESVLRSSANLEAESHVQVFSQAARLVRELLVEEGDLVRQDQVLARLQDDEQRNALTKVRSQLDNARREYDRQHRLFEQQLIAEQEFNDAAQEIDQLQISLADAERELGYTEVRAPIAGTVTSRLVNLGDQINPGQHLFDIVDFDSIVARIYVPEKALPLLRDGQSARIVAQALEGHGYDGVVKRIAPVVDAKSGTVKVTVAVGRQPGLLPGMYVDVDLVTATHRDAVLVPKRALVYDDDEMFVYRLAAENRVERVPVEAVLTDRNHIEPSTGLTVGDRVVIAGQAGLKDGALVDLLDEQGDDGERDAAEAAAGGQSAG